ncbi:hypothetical protein KGM_208360 [Danaus plexippus plexippus]|uniref:Uncharacterized protein n=1 Tax=Danaus plexippus plexippus TaxID=278856 RepID=A0A212ENV9_DANPL|nr:hypothetical protein KGM_208360 [Danaus plexippus plexippus]
MFFLFYCTILFFVFVECTHIFSLERDFSKLQKDTQLSKNAQEIVAKLRQFKVPVHPRIRLFFQLLKKAMLDHAQRNTDTLYNPNVYNELKDNAT